MSSSGELGWASFAITRRREWHAAHVSSSAEASGSVRSGDSSLAVHLPVALIGGFQPVCQSCTICIRETGAFEPALAVHMRPGNVSGAGTMTGFARHIHIGPCGCVGVGRQVEILL